MYPHERSLVQHFHDQPFVFLGVNSDADRATAKKVVAEQDLPCRCLWDGGPGGPISSRYKVQTWPTIYVLDANGVIRYTNVRGRALDQAIETLLREAQSVNTASANGASRE